MFKSDLRALVFMILVFVLVLAASSCGWLSSTTKQVGNGFLDCGKAEVVKATDELGPALRPLVKAGDVHALEALATHWTVDFGLCVLASVATLMAAEAPPTVSSEVVSPVAVFRQLAAVKAPGVKFHTPHGDLE